MDYYEIAKEANQKDNYAGVGVGQLPDHVLTNTICTLAESRGWDSDWAPSGFYDLNVDSGFKSLREFLRQVAPAISFLDYLDIEDNMINEERVYDNDYYSRKEFNVKYVLVDDVVALLKKLGYIS